MMTNFVYFENFVNMKIFKDIMDMVFFENFRNCVEKTHMDGFENLSYCLDQDFEKKIDHGLNPLTRED